MDHIVAADTNGIRTAAAALADGELVAFPTETVYGLGADATDDDAVAAIFAAKDRPRFNPLIVHTADRAAADNLVRFDMRAHRLAETFWPGALTLVLPRRSRSGLSLLVSAGLDTAAVRVPSHPVAHDLLRACRRPIAAPSANRSGEVSPTSAGHVAASLPGPDDGGPRLILDGSACPVGLESTVVDLSTDEATILRHGGVPQEELEAVIGPLAVAGVDETAPKSPGMLERHYAPGTPLRLDARDAADGEALLGFAMGRGKATLDLSPSGDLREAAANLFNMLRHLDDGGYATIAVAPIPEEGLGRAINDRLRRAAGGDENP